MQLFHEPADPLRVTIGGIEKSVQIGNHVLRFWS